VGKRLLGRAVGALAVASATDLQRAGLCSIQGATHICGVTRETVRKAITENAIQAAGKDGAGNDLYRIAEIVRAVDARGTKSAKTTGGEVTDPMKLPASERNSWFQSEQKRLDLEERAGNLVQKEDVAREFIALCVRIARYLDTLPDELERDAALSPEAVDVLHESIRRTRESLYADIAAKRPDAGDVDDLLKKLG
jgi:hypothetical protein